MDQTALRVALKSAMIIEAKIRRVRNYLRAKDKLGYDVDERLAMRIANLRVDVDILFESIPKESIPKEGQTK